MGCCSSTDDHCQVTPGADLPQAAAMHEHCPECGARGRTVKPITLDSLVRPGTTLLGESYRFCATVGCGVAWFGGQTGHMIPVAASRTRIGQKETAADRPICYCFGFSEADIIRDALAHPGSEHVPAEIAAHCRRGEDRCPETNPQGACCLGNVRAVIKAAGSPT